jgi:RNA polymerase sigma-70 factor (ECF subfamily)
MTPEDDHLSRIATQWSLVFRAHEDTGEAKTAAQAALLHRYRRAIYRYLLKVVGDSHAAEDLCQEFAFRFVRGDFHRVHPTSGRFRDFVKTAIVHLVADWRRRKQAGPVRQPLDTAVLQGAASPEPDVGKKFEEMWRAELLERVWDQLAQLQEEGAEEGSWFSTALRHRAEHPDQSAAEMAEEVGRQLKRPLTEESIRQTLSRGRKKFALLLLDEVARSLDTTSPEQLRDELTELGLLSYCRSALAQRGL